MTLPLLPVIIAGGGIGGLAAALAIARAGMPVVVLEQAQAFAEIGGGIQLAPNALRVLDRLGVLDAVKSKAVFVDQAVMIDALTGTEITRIELGEKFVARYGHRYLVVHRQDLLEALLGACRNTYGIDLRVNARIESFEQRDERVSVQCRDGKLLEGHSLIGADGLWSIVRSQMFSDGAPRFSGHICYRGVVPMDQIPDRSYGNAMALWVGPNVHLVQYPIRNGELMNNVAVIVSQEYFRGEKKYGEWSEVETLFATVHPKVRAMLAFIDRGQRWLLHDRDPKPTWSVGRTTLLGDAAHPTLQNMAQGACMALEDAVELADQIAMCPDHPESAFIAYQNARYIRTARVQLSARFVAQLVHLEGGARDVRNAVLSARDPTSTFELDWLYRAA